jgi:protein phosphatase
MGTTAVVVWLPEPGGVAWVAHVGDSRAYVWRDGQLQRLTEDHTWLNQMKRAGALPASPDDWPNRHMLSQALGGGAAAPAPDVSHLKLQAADVLLLCSDGLTDMLDDEAIARQLSAESNPQVIARALVNGANRQGGKDNITAVVIRVYHTG